MTTVIQLSRLIKPNPGGKRVLRWGVFSELADPRVWDELLHGKFVEISMSDLDFIAPDGVVWLSFILQYRDAYRLESHVLLPDDERQLAYLKYVGFHDLQQHLDFTFSNEFAFHYLKVEYPKDELQESLSRIHLVSGGNWSNIVYHSIQDVRRYLQDRFDILPTEDRAFEQVDPFIVTLRELVHNIALHGGAEDGNGAGVVSLVPPQKGFPLIRYCFSDIGRGFRETLEAKLGSTVPTDSEAILRGLLFRFEHPAEGILGLYRTLAFIRSKRGAIGIRTGEALLQLDLSSQTAQRRFDGGYQNPSSTWLLTLCRVSKGTHVPGAHIYVDLRVPPR